MNRTPIGIALFSACLSIAGCTNLNSGSTDGGLSMSGGQDGAGVGGGGAGGQDGAGASATGGVGGAAGSGGTEGGAGGVGGETSGGAGGAAGALPLGCETGMHACDGACVRDDAVESCGNACEPCAVPEFGEATCDGTSCDYVCDDTHKDCDGACIAAAACCEDSECPGGSTCESHTCACPDGTKVCGSGATLSCWPPGSCCDASECSNNFACIEGACRSFCEQQTRPDGVAAADYQCLDFDTSTVLPWTTSVSSGSAATTMTTVYSLPRSFESSYSAANGRGQMTWDTPGGLDITGITVSMRIRPVRPPPVQPPYEGGMSLLCLDSPGFSQCLAYTNLGTLYGSSGPIENYTGYYIHSELSSGAFLTVESPLSGNLNWDAWNTLSFDARSGGRVLFNGEDAGAAGAARGTTTKVTLGVSNNLGASSFTTYYDDVIVSVSR